MSKEKQKGSIIEIENAVEASRLIEDENYRLERFSESRNKYILIKRVRS